MERSRPIPVGHEAARMSPQADADPRDLLVDRLIAVGAADARVVAVFEGGSRARGESDEHSDIDVTVLVTDDALDEILGDKATFVGSIGRALFAEDFGIEHMAFVIFDDGTELEIHFYPVSGVDSIHAGPHRVLFDRAEMLLGRNFPAATPDASERTRRLREVLMWFWHDVDHFTTAIARNQLWWAAGQLEQLRNSCVNLLRLELGGEAEDEPYWKLDIEIATGPLEPLRSTFVPMERDALVTAGREVLTFFRAHGRAAALANGLPYPAELDALVGGRLDEPR
jgi:predicted nucleotidyltransferase